jgi:hypothetical protein
MYFSSNHTLVSFLSMQTDRPSQKSGYVPLSLFVQLFACSDPGYPDFAKLGECRPIFDTQTKLESLITHKVFENVQQTCCDGSSSILQRIFNFASEMMQKFVDQTSSRDHQNDITSSEQNLEYALCALVNISLSFRWCIESNVSPNPYSRVQLVDFEILPRTLAPEKGNAQASTSWKIWGSYVSSYLRLVVPHEQSLSL